MNKVKINVTRDSDGSCTSLNFEKIVTKKTWPSKKYLKSKDAHDQLVSLFTTFDGEKIEDNCKYIKNQ